MRITKSNRSLRNIPKWLFKVIILEQANVIWDAISYPSLRYYSASAAASCILQLSIVAVKNCKYNFYCLSLCAQTVLIMRFFKLISVSETIQCLCESVIFVII